MSFKHTRGWEKRQEERRSFEKKFHQEKRAKMAGLPIMGYSDGHRVFADMATGFSTATSAFSQLSSALYDYRDSNAISDMYRQSIGNTITLHAHQGSIPVGNVVPSAPPVIVAPEVRAPTLREVWAD